MAGRRAAGRLMDMLSGIVRLAVRRRVSELGWAGLKLERPSWLLRG